MGFSARGARSERSSFQRKLRSLGTAATALLLLILVASLGGCGEGEPAKPETKPAPPVGQAPAVPNPKPKKLAPAPGIRKELSMRVDIPDYYPKDAPVYPGTKPSSAGWVAGRVSAVFSSKDSPDQVRKVVHESLESQGWEEVTDGEMPNGVVISASKGDRGISVLVSRIDEDTDYEVTMMAVAVDP